MNVKSLYIHYPHCKHLCHYCDFYKKKYSTNNHHAFLSYLDKSQKVHEDFLDSYNLKVGPLETLYIGGGTPSLWAEDLEHFISKLKNKISFADDIEFTCEVDPGACGIDDLKGLRDLGVNRFSVGTQSIDSLVQPYLDRSHGIKEIYQLFENLNQLGLNFSADFMIGLALPPYIKRNIESELKVINSFGPNHLSLYILSVNENYPFSSWLPSDDAVAKEYLKVHEVNKSLGFHHYEVSNYAKLGFESKHNYKYWKQESYLSLGPSATGLLKFSDGSGVRYKWKPGQKPEIQTEELTQEQMELERFYTSSRTKEGLNIERFSKEKILILKDFEVRKFGSFKGNYFHFSAPGWVILDTLIERLI